MRSYTIATSRGLEMLYHGAAEIRGVNAPHLRYCNSGRFGRLFPTLPPLEAARESLLELGAIDGIMDGQGSKSRQSGRPARGLHLLGQFIDHDITFDPTSSLERQVDPEAVSNFRTSTLELDSGGRKIRREQVIDWTGFFQIDGSRPQVSKAIDTKLSWFYILKEAGLRTRAHRRRGVHWPPGG